MLPIGPAWLAYSHPGEIFFDHMYRVRYDVNYMLEFTECIFLLTVDRKVVLMVMKN